MGLRRILEKYGFPLGAKMLHFPTGKWVPGKHKMFLESLLHMVHVLQSSQKLRLASKKLSIFSGAIFPADVREIRHTKFCLKWLLGPSWARLSFYKKVWMPGTSESDKFMCFSSEIDFPKMGILEVDKSPSWPKMATMRISQKRSAGKKVP